MRKLVLPLLLCCLLRSVAQPYAPDTLLQQLRSETRDTSRVILLGKLSRSYLYSKPDTALFLADQGLALAKKIGFVRGQAYCTRSVGSVLAITGEHPKALELLLEALKKYESINDEDGVASVLVSIGIVYYDEGDFRESLKYSFKAKEIAERRHNEFNILVNVSNMGETYEKMNQLDSARVYTQQAYEISLRRKDDVGIGIALNNLGNIYNKMQQPALALEYYRASLPYQQEGRFNEGICETYLNITRLLQSRGQLDSCVYYAGLSFHIAQQEEFTNKLLDASKFLTAFYKEQHHIDSAFVYQEHLIAAKDSLFSQEKVKQVQRLSFAEAVREQELADEKARSLEERKNNLQLLGIAVFIVTFFLLVLLLSRKKTEPRTIEVFGVVALLLLFEFISLFIHPYISKWEHHNPILMLLTLVLIAAVLVPLHHKLENAIKEKWAHRIWRPAIAQKEVGVEGVEK